MSLDDLIITVFCRVDETVKQVLNGQRLRKSGPDPTLSDTEVLTLEVVGAFLKLSEDPQIYDYFRRHYLHFFPALRKVHRTTFVPPGCKPLEAQGTGVAGSVGAGSGTELRDRGQPSRAGLPFCPCPLL